MIITILDAMGIQDYIFGSNKLKDNIGASELVYMALNCLPIEVLQTKFPGRVNPSSGYQPDVSCSIINDNGKFDAELFYAGGGTTVVFSRTTRSQKSLRSPIQSGSWKMRRDCMWNVYTIRWEKIWRRHSKTHLLH